MATNKLFTDISKWKYGNEEEHGVVRREIVDFMWNNKTFYAAYIDGDVKSHLEQQRFTDGRLSSWDTKADVFAAAFLFNSTIVIHGDGQILTFKPQAEVPNGGEIHVRLNAGHLYLLSKSENTRKLQSEGCLWDVDWFDMITIGAEKIT